MQNSFAKTKQYLFYLLIFCIPFQVGKHFWAGFSYVGGFALDYLSPTLYLTDILIAVLFALSFKKIIHELKTKFQITGSAILSSPSKENFKFQIVSLLLLSLLIGIVRSASPWAGAYGLVKLVEMIFFGWYVYVFFKKEKNRQTLIARAFSLSVLLQSLLAFLQFWEQKSIGGIFYFLGERTFSAQTPGIANASISGHLILRPYATFSHPNVLSAYLLIAMVFILYNRKTLLSFSALLFGGAALFLTMSRISILLWAGIVVWWCFKEVKKKAQKKLIIAFVLIILFFLAHTPVGMRFFQTSLSDESLEKRLQLASYAFALFFKHPILGIGLNNFYTAISDFPKTSLSSLSSYLQPVHNLYLFVLSETGIVGFSAFIILIVAAFQHSLQGRHKYSVVLLGAVLILGMGDHYFRTLQQGQLLLAFVLGLSFAF